MLLSTRFNVMSVEAILQISYGLSLQGMSCVTFRPSEDMVRNFSAKGNEESTDDNAEIVSLEVDGK